MASSGERRAVAGSARWLGVLAIVAGCAGESAPATPSGVAATAAQLTVADCPSGYNVIQGTSGRDTLIGTAGSDCILGLGNDDILRGGGGADFLVGGSGHDMLQGEDGDDTAFGEGGNDTLEGGPGEDVLMGGIGADIIWGGDQDDRILGEAGDDKVHGEAGNDIISGGANLDRVWGGEGDDAIHGGDGNDVLYGEFGDDALIGGTGSNTIVGGSGTDACSGTACEKPALIPSGCTTDLQCAPAEHCIEDFGLCLGCVSDVDGDLTCDSADGCRLDAAKAAPGVCGCGVSDGDGDGDGTADCVDGCPSDRDKTAPGACGCGVSDDDGDGDGTLNCNDSCPDDPGKTVPGACGCGMSDGDADNDGVPDCNDRCDGYPDTDADADEMPDACEPLPFDQVAVGDGTVFMLARTAQRVLRWSIADERFLSPIALALGPQQIAYSRDNHRLHVGYTSGAITAVDPVTRVESSFATTPVKVVGMTAMGPRLFVADSNKNHSVFADTGMLVERRAGRYNSAGFEWCGANARIYQTRDGSSPNDVLYHQYDAAGRWLSSGESPYHGDYLIRHPIRASTECGRVLLGSGDVYDGMALTRLRSLPGSTIVDAAWLEEGRLLVLRAYDASFSLLEQYSAGLVLETARLVPGVGAAVSSLGTTAIVVTKVANLPRLTHYTPSQDGDGDGVEFPLDRFPLDPAASVDTDHDGFPDAWNPGKSAGDSLLGLLLDAFPQDAACQRAQDALGGAGGSQCDVAGSVQPYQPSQVVVDLRGTIYLLDANLQRVQRYDPIAGEYGNPIPVGPATHLAYSRDNDRLYVAYASGAIAQIDIQAAYPSPVPFAATPQTPHGLAAAGPFVLVADPSGAWESHHTFAADGSAIAEVDWNRRSLTYSFSPGNGRMYFTRDGISPNDLHFEEIDIMTGEIGVAGETPYHGDFIISHPVRASEDGAYVMLGSGDVYAGDTLERVHSLAMQPTDGLWLEDDTLLTIVAEDGSTLLQQWTPDFAVENVFLIEGSPLRVVGDAGGVTVITMSGGRPTFHPYSPGQDGDDDGVPFALDAFPLDPAASLDTDHDGWPDAWNEVAGPEDSTTGLVLDAFPLDSACQLAEHAIGGAGGSKCDIEGQIPAYIPDATALDVGGVLYMLSNEHAAIYRYSAVDYEHLNPIVVAEAPLHMTYAPDLERIYVGHASGQITSVDPSAEYPSEVPFASLPMAVHGLIAAGHYLIAADGSGAWNTHFSFAPDGTPISAVDWNYQSDDYAFCAATDRVYFMRNDQSPNDIHYEQIDPTSGQIVAAGESPYHGTYAIRAPVRVSSDGAYVLLGSGDVYDGMSLQHVRTLSAAPIDAAWTTDGQLITLTRNGEETDVLRYGTSLEFIGSSSVPGQPLRVFVHEEQLIVVTLENGSPAVHSSAF